MESPRDLCYVCMARRGRTGLCACKHMPLCSPCQERASQLLPSYENHTCPVCRTRYSNAPCESCSVHLGVVMLFFGVPISPVAVGILYSLTDGATVAWYVLSVCSLAGLMYLLCLCCVGNVAVEGDRVVLRRNSFILL